MREGESVVLLQAYLALAAPVRLRVNAGPKGLLGHLDGILEAGLWKAAHVRATCGGQAPNIRYSE
jgi:hypothetical protein